MSLHLQSQYYINQILTSVLVVTNAAVVQALGEGLEFSLLEDFQNLWNWGLSPYFPPLPLPGLHRNDLTCCLFCGTKKKQKPTDSDTHIT